MSQSISLRGLRLRSNSHSSSMGDCFRCSCQKFELEIPEQSWKLVWGRIGSNWKRWEPNVLVTTQEGAIQDGRNENVQVFARWNGKCSKIWPKNTWVKMEEPRSHISDSYEELFVGCLVDLIPTACSHCRFRPTWMSIAEHGVVSRWIEIAPKTQWNHARKPWLRRRSGRRFVFPV